MDNLAVLKDAFEAQEELNFQKRQLEEIERRMVKVRQQVLDAQREFDAAMVELYNAEIVKMCNISYRRYIRGVL